MKQLIFLLSAGILIQSALARDFHVSKNGNDKNEGSISNPFSTIMAAATAAQPGDVIIVHEGTYRERITPPRGGISDEQRIVYRAADNERAVIKGSEIITGWKKMKNGVWKVTVDNAFFGDYNPYMDIIEGDWFNDHGRQHHTGEVYLNEKALYEMDSLHKVTDPRPIDNCQDPEGSTYTWFCSIDDENTTIYANFHDFNPNKELVEINVRNSCFYPDRTGVNYITISGFHLSQAATQWAAPTAEQRGLIGTFWSKGWIIENNVISNSRCSGITLGKDRATGQDVWSHNRSKDGATHYNEVILRALDIGWSKDKIGSHIIINNEISHCEQTGICGSLGGVFSEITGNYIHDVWTKRQFSGAEIAGIKIHASIDMIIESNRLNNVGRGLWMDWMAQGTRLTGNLCYDNTMDDLFVEVNHGPFLVDNNLFLSDIAIRDWSEGGAYVHNLIAGAFEVRPIPNRTTPYHHAHATSMKGYKHIVGGDSRFYNNIFGKGIVQSPYGVNTGMTEKGPYGLDIYNNAASVMYVDGNAYYNGAKPFSKEKNAIVKDDFNPEIRIIEKDDHTHLHISFDSAIGELNNPLVNTKLLGSTIISEAGYEHTDGTPIEIDMDYFGKKRDTRDPSPGPFESPGSGELILKVW